MHCLIYTCTLRSCTQSGSQFLVCWNHKDTRIETKSLFLHDSSFFPFSSQPEHMNLSKHTENKFFLRPLTVLLCMSTEHYPVGVHLWIMRLKLILLLLQFKKQQQKKKKNQPQKQKQNLLPTVKPPPQKKKKKKKKKKQKQQKNPKKKKPQNKQPKKNKKKKNNKPITTKPKQQQNLL